MTRRRSIQKTRGNNERRKRDGTDGEATTCRNTKLFFYRKNSGEFFARPGPRLDTSRGTLTRPSCGRRMKREDTLRRLCATEGRRSWTDAAADRSAWLSLEKKFLEWY